MSLVLIAFSCFFSELVHAAGPEIAILKSSDLKAYNEAVEGFKASHAIELMLKHRSEHFDPELLDVFVASTEDLLRIHDQYADRVHSNTFRQP
ncbi:MAG: hypothetical protein CAF42_010635 [Nitrospira sp. CG24B]|nr:MAG: hypothetical protein CAF42_010635 [Nitrospira sp. CG24B]